MPDAERHLTLVPDLEEASPAERRPPPLTPSDRPHAALRAHVLLLAGWVVLIAVLGTLNHFHLLNGHGRPSPSECVYSDCP